MASEITYAEVKFNKTPPPTVPKASSKTETPLSLFQRIPFWFPWVMSGILMLLSIALLVCIFVLLQGWQKKTFLKNLSQHYTNWHCLLETEQKLTCCQEGWKPFQSSCYYFSTQKTTWNDSRRQCVEMKSDLVVINVEAEQDFLINQTKNLRESNFCIGLTELEKKGEWRWVDRTTINATGTFWRTGEPSKGDERCVVMHIKSENNDKNNWNNVRCSPDDHYYICESKAFVLD